MTHDHDDAGEDLLAGLDLHVWRVPPPPAIHGPSLLVRAVAAGATPAKRVRARWVLAALVLVNAAIAALLVIVLAPASTTQPTVVARPAGGGSVDAKVRELLQRLEVEQRELERKLAEIQELRALVAELSEKVRLYEENDDRRDRTVPKQRKRPAPERGVRSEPVEQPPVNPFEDVEPSPVDPFSAPRTSRGGSCDEVSCVLGSGDDACCAKYRAPRKEPANPFAGAVPDALDRHAISTGISRVKARVAACGRQSTAHGKVKVKVHVGANGRVTNVIVEATPDAALGACVAAAIQRAVFARTQKGGSFSYPFVF